MGGSSGINIRGKLNDEVMINDPMIIDYLYRTDEHVCSNANI